MFTVIMLASGGYAGQGWVTLQNWKNWPPLQVLLLQVVLPNGIMVIVWIMDEKFKSQNAKSQKINEYPWQLNDWGSIAEFIKAVQQ